MVSVFFIEYFKTYPLSLLYYHLLFFNMEYGHYHNFAAEEPSDTEVSFLSML